ncbi:MAG TPA: C10 family peptidase [Bacteroidales bacterium]|nr:C10 family peptidase [Bacteroidales bacterium]
MLKKIILHLLWLSIVLMPLSLFSQNLSRDEVRNLAILFYKEINKQCNDSLISDELFIRTGNSENIAIFCFQSGGFVALSMYKGVAPIIAYSGEGFHDLNTIPENALLWYSSCSKEIDAMRISCPNSSKHMNEWTQLMSGTLKHSSVKSTNLLTTEWGQGCYYNTQCPADVNGPCGHTVTGCVATSMAMIMKHWNYPEHGFGANSYQTNYYGVLSADFENTTYQWNEMPDILIEENVALSTLMYQCGVAVNMQYTATSSGAAPGPSNFTAHFGYSPNAHVVYRSDYSDEEWVALMKWEIDNNRPVQYVGDSDVFPDGHAWVCDGYDENDYLHFNWGWDNLGGFYEPGTGIFPLNQYATIGIMPAAQCDIAVTELLAPYSQTFTEPAYITVKIENFSLEPISDIPVSYTVNNGIPVAEIVEQVIEPMSSVLYTFYTPCDFSQEQGSIYNVSVFSSLACDAYLYNDTLHSGIESVMCAETPYVMGFTADESSAGWHSEDANNDGNTWQIPAYNPAIENDYAFYQCNGVQADDWLFTKCLILGVNKMYRLSFDYKATGMYWPQNLEVRLGTAQSNEDMYLVLDSIVGFNNSQPETCVVYFTADEHPHHYIGFHSFSEPDMLAMTIDNIVVEEMAEPDVAVVDIISPAESCNMSTEPVTVKIRNLSSATLSQLPLSYILNNGAVVQNIVDVSLLPGETYTYTFEEPVDMSAYGAFNLKVYSSYATDLNHANDTLIRDYQNIEAGEIPYINGFDDEESLEGYVIENTNNDNRYWQYYPSAGHQNLGCMRYEYSDFNAADDWFFTRCLFLEPEYIYTLSFYQKVESSQWHESMEVYFGQNPTSAFMNSILLNLPDLSNELWQDEHTDFSVPEEGFYYIGFHCNSGAQMFNLYIDDIQVDGEINHANTWESISISVFPNPASERVYIRIPEIAEYNISIYDVQGRVVLKNQGYSEIINVDTENLNSGIYMIEIRTNRQVYNSKLVVR